MDSPAETKVNKKRISNIFKHSHDFLKIGRKVKSTTEAKKQKDAQVKGNGRPSGSGRKNNKQENSEKENMQTINHSTSDQQQPTLNRFSKINKVKIVADCRPGIHDNIPFNPHYLKISNNVPQIDHNNVGTQETMLQVQLLHQLINQLKELLEQERRDILGPANNLLFIHSQLSEIEISRDNTVRQASFASRDTINTLEAYFRPLNELSDEFDSHLWQLTRNIIHLANNGQASTAIARLVMVIEREEEADSSAQHAHSLYTKKSEARAIKSYRKQFLIKLRDTVTEMFEIALNKVKEFPSQLIDQLEFVYRDLKLVKEHIALQFPAHYNITCFFVLAYHENVRFWLDVVLQGELDAGSKLRLIRWVRQYYSIVVNEMQVSRDLLEPQLLDGQEQALVDDYLSLMRGKFQEWKSNLLESDIREFKQRIEEPNKDPNKMFGLTGSPILINMINQQIDVAIESTHEKILADVITEGCQVMRDVQEAWNRTLKSELASFLENKEELPGGLLEYIIALANDQLHFADFADELTKSLTPALLGEHFVRIKKDLLSVMDGYLHFSIDVIDSILSIIFDDLKEPFRKLHSSTTRNKVDHMEVIVVTLKDYTDECQMHLKPYLFNKLMSLMAQRFVIAYIQSMGNRGSRYCMPGCLERMHQDVLVAQKYFGMYLRPNELERQFDPITKIHNFISTTQEMVHLDYHALKKSYGDVPRRFLKVILSKRDDLGLLQLKNISKIIKAKELAAGQYVGEPTIFSKIEVNYESFTSEQIKNEMDTLKDDVKQMKHGLKEAFGKMKLRNRY
ncbi:3818_t:CDS:2 [Acaulospora morrowiae]|uniref:3818_t:CDS:1 n=1 Tax=Acaulospora morrowiae TaxID=94023 RepID=A0A9N9FWV6_9GLOM|nr:3818_t:CDS:2 [Acaulospora morrowiae]